MGIEGVVEEGWQGPPGSPSFAGFLKVQVALDDGRSGVLTAWCVMAETPHYRGHVSDGISLRGEGLAFTGSSQNEMGLEGVMFYGRGAPRAGRSRENPRWGYMRIKGELGKLGIAVSATSVAMLLRRSGVGPAPAVARRGASS